MLQAQSAKALKFLEEALLSSAKGDNESNNQECLEQSCAVDLPSRKKHKQILPNMAHSNRAKETFADSPDAIHWICVIRRGLARSSTSAAGR